MKKILGISLVLLFMMPVVFALTLAVNNPVSPAKSNSNYVSVDLSSSETSDFFYSYNDNMGIWSNLCLKTNKCVRKIKMNEGNNTIKLRAINKNGAFDTKNLNVLVDTVRPKILGITPRNNLFVNSSIFSISYREENLDKIIFHYKKATQNEQTVVGNSSCLSGVDKTCSFTVSGYEGKIAFWFEIIDTVGNKIISTKNTVEIDSTKPNMVNFSGIPQEDNRVKFVFDITEKNFKEIVYSDDSTCNLINPNVEYLCSSLTAGRCINTKKFCSGDHSITFTVKDKAGNSDTKVTSFTI